MPEHVDLTHPIEDGMQTYPGDPAVELSDHATHDADGYHVEALTCGSHTGTHVDAPLHTESDGDPLSAFSLDRFVFDAVRIDCRDCEPRDAIAPDRLPDSDALADADMAVFWTGWADHWNTDRYLD
ncbi:MAG: putative metal-dependent hydrolase, partial [uncultured archaeon A07HN63]